MDARFFETERKGIMQTITIKGKRVPVPWLYSQTHSSCDHGTIVTASDGEFWANRFYGGHIICSGINPAYMPLILAVPRLFVGLKDLAANVGRGDLDSESLHDGLTLIGELETP